MFAPSNCSIAARRARDPRTEQPFAHISGSGVPRCPRTRKTIVVFFASQSVQFPRTGFGDKCRICIHTVNFRMAPDAGTVGDLIGQALPESPSPELPNPRPLVSEGHSDAASRGLGPP